MVLPAQSIFLTGTDTEIGKTTVGAALARAWVSAGANVAAMKPVAAGLVNGKSEDLLELDAACNLRLPKELACVYALTEPIAPHLAAAHAGVRIEARHIAESYKSAQKHLFYTYAATFSRENAPAILVEGAGGALVPLNEREDMLDIAALCDLPVVFVVGIRLGCINHARLTEAAILARGLKCLGWIANVLDPNMPFLHENIETLKSALKTPFLAICPYRGAMPFVTLTRA
jgi:dethiobiotin synthetase